MTKHPSRRIIRSVEDLPATHWIRRQGAIGSLRPYAEDRAIGLVTRSVLNAISEAQLNRAEVARLLGTTKSYVSQALNGSTNMTLRTLGALLWASGRQVAELRTETLGTVARLDHAIPVFAGTMMTTPPRDTPAMRVTRVQHFGERPQ